MYIPRKSAHRIPEEKQELLRGIIQGYNVQTTQDLQEALKDLLGGAMQAMLEQELDTQIEEREASDPDYHDSRNGYKPKRLRSSAGEIPISVPQDRNSDFELIVVGKYQRDISEIEGKIIAMYARGLSTRQISDQIRDIYGFDVSEGMVMGITNKLLPEIEAWQKRPLTIAARKGVGEGSVRKYRKQYATEGLEAVLLCKKRDTPSVLAPAKVTGEVEAHIIATCCSEPPAGKSAWSMQMIADKIVLDAVFITLP